MTPPNKIRVAVNGYGVIGKRVAEAVTRQDDMELAGIADVDTDWRLRVATRTNGFRLYGADGERAEAMQRAGLDVDGTLDDPSRPTIARIAGSCASRSASLTSS
jgi:glyceraldehyde-3-phosphate dehydrogenase (NAD(P))